MALHAALIKKRSQRYAANGLVNLRYAGKDLTVKTGDAGNVILLFIGRRTDNGHIQERYSRRLAYEETDRMSVDQPGAQGQEHRSNLPQYVEACIRFSAISPAAGERVYPAGSAAGSEGHQCQVFSGSGPYGTMIAEPNSSTLNQSL